MKLIIAGGRYFDNWEMMKWNAMHFIKENLKYDNEEVVIISGSCDRGTHTFTRKDGTKVYGADGLGEKFAEMMGYAVEIFAADWKKHGTSAGPIRNREMGETGTHALTLHDGKSRGTANMIKVAKANNLVLKEVRY